MQYINDIDAGNSNLSENEQLKLLHILQDLNKEELNRVESAEYLGVCTSTFDNYVAKGKIPKGTRRRGSELFWNKRDLVL